MQPTTCTKVEKLIRLIQLETTIKSMNIGNKHYIMTKTAEKIKLPRFKQASWFEHFHSLSLAKKISLDRSSEIRGTQPPNTNMRLDMTVAECSERGNGAFPHTISLVHCIVPVKTYTQIINV